MLLALLILASHCPLTRSTDFAPLPCPDSERPLIHSPSPTALPESDLLIPPFSIDTIFATLCRIGVEGGDELARATNEVRPVEDEEWEFGVFR